MRIPYYYVGKKGAEGAFTPSTELAQFGTNLERVAFEDAAVNHPPTFAFLSEILGADSRQTVEYLIAPENYELFRKEDLGEWIFFTLFTAFLLYLDNFVLLRECRVITLKEGFLYMFGWIAVACCFGVYVCLTRGLSDGAIWMTGYSLEWMLSLDNLFCFHMVFNTYGCPRSQRHKPLFWGIIGAIIFRMTFFIVGETVMHTMHFMHIIFGTFLIYTGWQTWGGDDDEADPTQNGLVLFLKDTIPLLTGYSKDGSFFMKVGIDRDGKEIMPKTVMGSLKASEGGSGAANNAPPVYDPSSPRVGGSEDPSKAYKTEWRATMLFLVVICLEITDVLFAVDSVTAIVAAVPNLYLAYTACIFAMLGLRACFFVVDELVRLFALLQYGVAIILVFIGVKLILSKMIHIPEWIVLLFFALTMGSCVAGSVWLGKYKEAHDSARDHNDETIAA